MRVVSLVPAATEIVAALGGADRLVGISHECDYPPAAQRLPRITATPVDTTKPNGAIDAEVRQLVESGTPLFTVELDRLRQLSPSLLLTQNVCEVCAVDDGITYRIAAAMQPAPRVVALQARTLGGIWDDIHAIAAALDLRAEADELIAGLESRLHRLRAQAPAGPPRRVLCIEWLDPLYLAGHWVPDMVAAAGAMDVGAAPGAHSARWPWPDVRALSPDVIIVMLCGLGVERTRRELDTFDNAEARALFAERPTWIMDGNAYTSRSGPRVVDGVERIQSAIAGRAMPGLARWQA